MSFGSDSVESDQDKIDQVFAAQKKHAIHLRRSTAAERIEKLKILKEAIDEHWEDFVLAAYQDSRKPRQEVEISERIVTVSNINYMIKNLKRWMRPKRVRSPLLMFGTRGMVQYEPKGASLIISPWNYPCQLTMLPLASAISAGCPAIIKPSEFSPKQSEVMARMLHAAFPEKEVYVFQGGPETAKALLAKPFDHIFYTGSPKVGKLVMEAAAKHLASITLELGGKSPAIVDETANVSNAARTICQGKFFNCGHTCIAPDHVFVHEKIRDQFIQEAEKWLRFFYGDDAAKTPDYGRVVNDLHFNRIISLIEEAKKEGKKVILGGRSDREQRYIEPTLIQSDLGDQTRVMQEEIFGPLLPVVPYKDTASVIDEINTKPKPLSLYIYTKSKSQRDHLLKGTSAGGTSINNSYIHSAQVNLPFGGINNSGLGNYHGEWGFRAFSHERSVVEDKFSLFSYMTPPYERLFIRLIDKILPYIS